MSAAVTLGAEPGSPPVFAKLSAEQSRALAHDAELAVVAGAGAGKTSTLAARYVLLLHTLIERSGEAPPPHAVLVLTFTQRAATEMRERCGTMVEAMVAALAEAARTASPSARGALQKRERAWRLVRDRLPAATIHTFHGFCSRLLREFPAETGTSPGAAALDEPGSALRMHQAALDTVLPWLDAGGAQVPLLLSAFGGARPLAEAVQSLLGRRGELRETFLRYAAAQEADTAILAKYGVNEEALRERLEEWSALATRVLRATGGAQTDWLTELASVLDAVRAEPSGDPLELSERWRNALGALQNRSGGFRDITHHTSIGKKDLYGATFRTVKAELELVAEHFAQWEEEVLRSGRVPTRHDRTLAEVRHALAGLVLEAERRLVAGFDTAAELDFAEMIARARRAVVEGGLARTLHARHRYVMVDEFQDTDVDQWAIVAAITRAEGPSDRLFVVGDPKQSIYGFRGGDVAVFERARRTMANGCVFADNHRSRPEIVDFVNHAFGTILSRPPASTALWHVGYDPMKAASARPGGSVVAALAPAGDLGSTEKAAREARWIAQTIRDRVLGATGPWAGTAYADVGQHPKPPIAILVHRRRHLAMFEAALSEAGVPCLVADGSGFWRRPEVLDLVHSLRALATADPAATVGALRSPLFGVPDRALALLARTGRLSTFADGPAPVELAGEVELLRAWAAFARLREELPRRSVAGLLEAILAEGRAPWVLTLATPDGRAEANVAQLLARADEAASAGVSPEAFARDALDRAADDVREAEAVLPDSGVRVVLLTIHASKGLEWPVVILPQLGSALRGSASRERIVLAREDDGGWEFALAVPDLHGPVIGRATPAGLVRARDRVAELELAESRRVFYVACTRARDHLLLVAHEPKKKKTGGEPGSFFEMLGELPPEGLVLRESIEPVDRPAGGDQPARAAADPGGPTAEDLAPIPTRTTLVIGASSVEPQLRAAGLLQAAAEPAFTLPKEPLPSDTAGPERERVRRAVAIARGLVIHGLLEDECLWEEALAADRWRAEGIAEGLTVGEVREAWPSVLAQVRAMRESPDLLAVLDAKGAAELPMRLDLGGIRVEGRIDRLCRDLAGVHGPAGWMVVDYKTEDPGPAPLETASRHRTQLLAYSLAASRVLAANAQGEVVRAGVLFTRTGTLVRLPDWTEGDRQALVEGLRALAATRS